MKKAYIFFFVLILQGCADVEEYSTTSLILSNTSSHEIAILPYQTGIIDSSKQRFLQPMQTVEIENTFLRGKSQAPVHFDDYFRNVDSIQIVWDNKYTIVHMIADSFQSSKKYISFFNSHNIGKTNNYAVTSSETKHSIKWGLTYYFTEADYEYAKD